MTKQFAVVPTREGLEGVKDKAAIMDAIARRVARGDREFVNRVREIVKGAGNEADRKVEVWVRHCKGLTYTREYGEIFAHPMETLKKGGDCDDMVILLLAGLHSMLIPCCPDIVTKDGEGVHVRARVGLPPTSPPPNRADWLVADPVEDSEKAWAMVGQGAKTPLLGQSFDIGQGVQSLLAQADIQPVQASSIQASPAQENQPPLAGLAGKAAGSVPNPALAALGKPETSYGILAVVAAVSVGVILYALTRDGETYDLGSQGRSGYA